MSGIKLTVYVEPKLLGSTGTLILARKVNDRGNCVFHTAPDSYLEERNEFEWQNTYQIGVSDWLISGGAMKMRPKGIKPGEVFDFSQNKPYHEIPNAGPAPSTFPPGSFGTIGLEPDDKVIVICATADRYEAIYADTDGSPTRTYTVENNYQVSWERNFNPTSTYVENWAGSWDFSIPAPQTEKWISWGTNASGQKHWFAYNADPGQHDPSKAT